MNSGNLILGVVGAVIAAFIYMLSDASSDRPASATVSNSQLRSAIASGQPVLLEFYADWCGPCRAVGPVVDELAQEVRGKAKVIRLNVDQNRELAQQYQVRGIPAFITLKQGRETARVTCAIDKTRMRQMLGM